jgi:hypothetical protein
MSQLCVFHRVLAGQCDPNELPIESLHMRLVHMTTNFVLQPSGALADNIARLLSALSRHNDRHGAATGEDMYARAALIWQGIAIDQLPDSERQHLAGRATH